jgi:hypothetical protein
METPLLYRQLQEQLRQWVQPKDQRHLQGFAEIVAAIVQSESACLGKWMSYVYLWCMRKGEETAYPAGKGKRPDEDTP